MSTSPGSNMHHFESQPERDGKPKNPIVARPSAPVTDSVPSRIWLTDGGAFSNFGTEWSRIWDDLYFRGMNGMRKYIDAAVPLFAEVQLVIDASQSAPVTSLRRLHVPILAFFTYVVRTMDVLYGSTLASRSQDAVRDAALRMLNEPKKWHLKAPRRAAAARQGVGESHERTGIAADHRIAQEVRAHVPLDDPIFDAKGQSRRPLRGFVPLQLKLGDAMNRWSTFGYRYSGVDVDLSDCPADWAYRDNVLRYERKLSEAKQQFGELWPTDELVPTAFNSLGRRCALRLIVYGYLMTREVLTAAFPPYRPCQIPSVAWFEELLPATNELGSARRRFRLPWTLKG